MNTQPIEQLDLFIMTKEEREEHMWDKREDEHIRRMEAQERKDWEAYKRAKPLQDAKHQAEMQAEYDEWAKGGIFDTNEYTCWLIRGRERVQGTQWP